MSNRPRRILSCVGKHKIRHSTRIVYDLDKMINEYFPETRPSSCAGRRSDSSNKKILLFRKLKSK